MTALLVYQHQITHTANLIWILYVPSGLLLGGGFLYYRYRSHVSVQEDGVKVSTLMNSVLLEYDSLKPGRRRRLAQTSMDRGAGRSGPGRNRKLARPPPSSRTAADKP